jgi:excisionase family DNA binding protein
VLSYLFWKSFVCAFGEQFSLGNMSNMIILQGVTLEEFFKIDEEIVEKKINEKIKIEKKETFSYLTRKEVAKMLRITLPTLHEWTKMGWLPSYRIGTRVLYKSNEIDAAVIDRKFRRHQY